MLHDDDDRVGTDGTGTTEEGKQSQNRRSRSTNQATTTKPVLFTVDVFVATLGVIPQDDSVTGADSRTWSAGRTIMLRKTSKRVKEV